MFRRALIAVCLGAFVLTLGCGTSEDKKTNPDNLPYSKQEGPQGGKGGGAPGAPKK